MPWIGSRVGFRLRHLLSQFTLQPQHHCFNGCVCQRNQLFSVTSPCGVESDVPGASLLFIKVLCGPPHKPQFLSLTIVINWVAVFGRIHRPGYVVPIWECLKIGAPMGARMTFLLTEKRMARAPSFWDIPISPLLLLLPASGTSPACLGFLRTSYGVRWWEGGENPCLTAASISTLVADQRRSFWVKCGQLSSNVSTHEHTCRQKWMAWLSVV